ncbi:MFS transporter [Streptomyces sp. NPDC048508]|uniref:MFS transporter n=1 Tax=Streptomyces sp. NPDC048508 TaxID=3365561 RepID=UPI003710601E
MSRQVWILLSSDGLSALGSGMTVPFLIVYLESARGFSPQMSSAMVSVIALVGIFGNPLAGAFSDRTGPRIVLAVGLTVSAMGTLILCLASQLWEAFFATATLGLGYSLSWPSFNTLLAQLVSRKQYSLAFSLRHATSNGGIAAGGLLSALMLSPNNSSSFSFLYMMDAITFLLAVPILWLIKIPIGTESRGTNQAASEQRDIQNGSLLRDKLFCRLWLLTTMLVAVGFAQFNVTFPAYFLHLGADNRILAFAFAAATLTALMIQVVTLKLVYGRRRTYAMALMCAIWAFSWTLAVAASTVTESRVPFLAILCAVTFALGETLLAPTISPIVNYIAPTGMQGRYNAGEALAYSAGFVIGPLISGFMLSRGFSVQLFGFLIGACILGIFLSFRLGKFLPISISRI